MFILKIIGALFLITSTSVFGITLGNEYIKRIENLKELRKLLILIEGELKYNNSPIKHAFMKISARKNSIYCDFLSEIANSMESDVGLNLSIAWKKAIDIHIRETIVLKERDVKLLEEFGNDLENLQVNNIDSIFKEYMNRIDLEIDEASEEKENRVKLYRTLGVGLGMFVTVLIV